MNATRKLDLAIAAVTLLALTFMAAGAARAPAGLNQGQADPLIQGL